MPRVWPRFAVDRTRLSVPISKLEITDAVLHVSYGGQKARIALRERRWQETAAANTAPAPARDSAAGGPKRVLMRGILLPLCWGVCCCVSSGKRNSYRVELAILISPCRVRVSPKKRVQMSTGNVVTEIRVGLLGFGTIGAGMVKCIAKNADIMAGRTGVRLRVSGIADLDISTDRGVPVDSSLLTTDALSVIDSPDVDVIVVPVGGGGMICGIALAMKALGKTPQIIACEIESSTPLHSAKIQGKPVKVERGNSWIDGIGSTIVLSEMWPLLDVLVDDVIVVSHLEAERALRSLSSKAHLVAEGAGAVALAAAMHPQFCGQKVVAVISGGNIDPKTYGEILNSNYLYDN